LNYVKVPLHYTLQKTIKKALLVPSIAFSYLTYSLDLNIDPVNLL